MGSFSELVLSFYFRDDTPPEVLAAFSALEQPVPEGAMQGPAPELPEPVREPVEGWAPDWREIGFGYTDEFEDQPWRHDWASWLSGSMSVGTVPSAALVWSELGRWHLSCRCAFKTWAGSIFEFLEWLAPFISASPEEEYPTLVGYIEDDQDLRPHLLWIKNGRLVKEDLNAGASGLA